MPPVRGVDEPDVARGLDIGEGDILPFKCGGDLECKRGLPIGETGQETFLGMWILLKPKESSIRQGYKTNYFFFSAAHFFSRLNFIFFFLVFSSLIKE